MTKIKSRIKDALMTALAVVTQTYARLRGMRIEDE